MGAAAIDQAATVGAELRCADRCTLAPYLSLALCACPPTANFQCHQVVSMEKHSAPGRSRRRTITSQLKQTCGGLAVLKLELLGTTKIANTKFLLHSPLPESASHNGPVCTT